MKEKQVHFTTRIEYVVQNKMESFRNEISNPEVSSRYFIYSLMANDLSAIKLIIQCCSNIKKIISKDELFYYLGILKTLVL